jgi:hypothetical protein
MITERIWILISYFLGSIPSGFLIAKVYGKNILEIGWRKTSGSNVFKNVGKLAGILTGVADLLKGYLAVLGAQKLGFSPQIQVFSGLAVVIGHNWSIFIKFAGGRGIGTFVGCLLAFSSKILGLSFIPLLAVALIWNSSIGTLVFLVAVIIFSLLFNQFEISGFFATFSLIPILIKRLSPIADFVEPRPQGREEIFRSDRKAVLFRNRILFDNDEALFSLRINRIIKKVNESKMLKFLANFILLPPKVGWRVAKFGVKVGVTAVTKPIEFIFGPPEKIITEIKPEDLKEMMKASAQKIVQHQEEINKINVFPVADKDTGYNMAATLLGVEGVVAQRKYNSFSELTKDIREGAMINARGNAGMIYTGYLIGFLNKIKDLKTIDGVNFASAMKKGTNSAYSAILNPVEGTILDVIRTAGKKADEMAKVKKERNIIKILEEALIVGQKALAETKEKLDVLKQNDVVDAGGLGFVKILEAWIESLKGEVGNKKEDLESLTKSLYENNVNNKEPEYKYEVIFIVGKQGLQLEKLKDDLNLLGTSIDFLESENKVKIHIHTNSPANIKEAIRNLKVIDWREEELQIQKKEITKKKTLGSVVGETADLPPEFLEKNEIETVPFKIKFNEPEKNEKESFYERLKKAKKLPTSSAPTFSDYLDHYKKALEKFEKILVLTLPSRLSGAYSQARIARSIFKKPEKLNILVFDCFTAGVAEGLVVMKVQELISRGKKVEEIIEELKIFCPKVKLLGLISNFKYVAQGGRIRIFKLFVPLISLIQKVGILFLFSLEDGKVRFLGPRLGKNLAEVLAREVENKSGKKLIKVAIGHADNSEAANELKNILDKNPKSEVLFTSSITPVIGVHTGPGALLVGFYTVES